MFFKDVSGSREECFGSLERRFGDRMYDSKNGIPVSDGCSLEAKKSVETLRIWMEE